MVVSSAGRDSMPPLESIRLLGPSQTEDRLDTLFLMNDKFPWRAERRVNGTAPTVGSPDSGSRFQPQTRVSLRAREG